MLDFLTTYWPSLVVVAAFIAVIVILALRGKKQIIYKMLYVLVTEAENRYGSGKGAEKFAEVMTEIYSRLPVIIKVFISYDTLARWIEEVLAQAKEHWAEQAGIEGEK